ncbi:MAG: response regulator transcription factor [Actinomycetota bacterium]
MAKILIVDDEPSVLKLLKMNLELEGFEAFLASDGATALKRIQSEEPDLVLLDIMMPVMDGWEVLRRLGESGPRKRPVVIVMTAKGKRDHARCLELGAHAYVAKPFETDVVIDKVREFLSLSAEEIESRRRQELRELKSG